jgi:hypothetical protein
MHQWSEMQASGKFYEGDIVNYLKPVVWTISAKCLLGTILYEK